MNITILKWEFRGQPVYTIFAYRLKRQFFRGVRKFFLCADLGGPSVLEDLETWEIGQLMGGN